MGYFFAARVFLPDPTQKNFTAYPRRGELLSASVRCVEQNYRLYLN